MIAVGEFMKKVDGGMIPDIDTGIPTEAAVGLLYHSGELLFILGGLLTTYGIAHKVDRARRD